MSKTEELYKEAIEKMIIHSNVHFNASEFIFKVIYKDVPLNNNYTIRGIDVFKTLESLKQLVSDYYISHSYTYRRDDGDVGIIHKEYIDFYTIEYPAAFYFTLRRNCNEEIIDQEVTIDACGNHLDMYNCIHLLPDLEETKFFRYVVYNGKFESEMLEAKNMEIDLNKNYNDDLPHEKIMNFINSGNSGLAILYGKPGCGKTSYIRRLMYNSDKEFVYLDQSLFSYICDPSFIRFLMNNRNCIFILEDCETLLADRITTNNSRLATLLNISDGLLGDSLSIKFICTFNCELNKLDSAIKRKGRLKIQYEFKPLVPEKANALIASLGKEVKHDCTLAQIYNSEDNGAEELKRNKIGF